MKFGYMINKQTVMLQFSDGHPEIVPIANAKDIIEALKQGRPESEIRNMVDRTKCVCDYMQGTVVVKGGRVFYKDELVENAVVRKILEFIENGYPYKPLVAFLARLMENPSRRAVQELYGFLSNENLSITDSGTFLAYKAVRPNWTDKHSGTFDNHVGRTLSMPRQAVDDDCTRGCSYGFHVGSLKYVDSFKDINDHVVIVEVDPADVVSVPKEDCGKVRVCKYTVVGEFKAPLAPYTPDEPAPQPKRRKLPKGNPKEDYFRDCPAEEEGSTLENGCDCPYYDTNNCPYAECILDQAPDDDGDDD